MNDFFNLDDLNDRTEGSNHAGGIVGLLVRALLAVTTAGFFFLYGSLLFEWLVGAEYAAWVARWLVQPPLTAWHSPGRECARPRQHRCSDDRRQHRHGGQHGISVLITVIFIVLRTTWVSLTAADGSLTAAGWAVNLLGLTCMTLAIAGNGVLVSCITNTTAPTLATAAPCHDGRLPQLG